MKKGDIVIGMVFPIGIGIGQVINTPDQSETGETEVLLQDVDDIVHNAHIVDWSYQQWPFATWNMRDAQVIEAAE